MPKKMGENTKAVEARERKAAAKKAQNEKIAKEKEDALWQDDDKTLAKKKQRKEEEEKKRAEQLKKKQEAKQLLEEEMSSIKTTGKPSIQKITRAQIQKEVETRNKNIEAINKPAKPKNELLEENINRVNLDSTVATTVDEAIAALSLTEEALDKHPEKRLKAAFKAFEEENMNRIKLENPTLKMSQWKQLLWKEWTRSPQNPLNQPR
ncbi:coiled-coil domain-containing protein 124 [Lutzomyia longipalpis]|uniref:Putative coiled-coil domain-containing protein n=1 Tax=Lutzomyia longipalpis TaxID=7200 RepID=A0A7G3A967_LUTLO|nr:coiled-coil domain-containing protein 124 [Lutzomyia longipalpis]XP_055677892.1 coiled-coil domain-containing protein 124 [Lutzomyia longipalpis]XP_055677893.1 coiled-coil domain-containing protein 124 [Lutzomyia longipalpis]